MVRIGEIEGGTAKFLIFYTIMFGLFSLYVATNDFTPFNEALVSPVDVDLTASLDPLSMLQKVRFMTIIAIDPSFIILSIIISGLAVPFFYILIKALPFT